MIRMQTFEFSTPELALLVQHMTGGAMPFDAKAAADLGSSEADLEGVRPCVENQVDVALTVERHVLGTMAAGARETQAGKELARVRWGIRVHANSRNEKACRLGVGGGSNNSTR
jgi:hypothetical protein